MNYAERPTCFGKDEDNCPAGHSATTDGDLPAVEITTPHPLHDVIELRQVARGVEPQTIRLTKKQAESLMIGLGAAMGRLV